MIEIYRKTIQDSVLKRLDSIKKGSWIYVVEPTSKEIKFLEKKIKIEKGAILDALDIHETSRIEFDNKKNIYIFLRTPHKDQNQIITHPFLIVIKKDLFITISKTSLEIFGLLFEEAYFKRTQLSTTQQTRFLLQLFLLVNSAYKRDLTLIERNIRFKQLNITKVTNKDILDFVEYERVLNDFITSLVPIKNIYNILLSKKILPLYKDDKELIKDLSLSKDEIIDICKTNIKSIVNIRGAYSTILNNNLNRTIKFLTAMTIILSVPVLIASVYGMNVYLPLQEKNWAFLAILIFMAVVGFSIFLFFRKKDWL